MVIEKVAFDKTNQFSTIFTDYINGESRLQPFYDKPPKAESFKKQLQEKKLSAEHRKILCQVLTSQYEKLNEVDDRVSTNIELLKDSRTFTITTGHQLNIFTGPLYFIYKIVSVINTCKALKEAYPDYNFVPVYWMASEDHDFEEISYFRLNGKKIKWKTSQTGAVGRFDPKELKTIIEETPGIPDFFKKAYLKNDSLADAVRDYVNHLFGKHGLVVLDADDSELKKIFSEVILDDCTNNTANSLVNEQSKILDEAGYKTQVYPREINFFYLKDGLRSRLVKENNEYQVLDSDISFTEEGLKKEFEEHPERFSPNVILRPLYQEVILPNLAYFGGPGELAYWFQLKTVFDHYKVPFPILMPRNFALVIPGHVKRKMDKAELTTLDVFTPKHELLKNLALANAQHDIHLNGQRDGILDLFEKVKAMAANIDPTLAPHVEAQQTITANRLDAIQKKFIRAEKKNQADRMRQVEDILENLLPNGTLQERTDNFLNFFMANPSFVDQLIDYFEPFDFRFNVLIDG
ncbi:bacillithiol biosynthesis cysteine-adding enzyme BshC [Fulvivirga sp. RKSG066]|uniref:bacillithiol biosynthesis cysteine-adding enzyme BshC n=1 Tax=Fulvivirga aurantia TaxID=2529383 RepID=UPI0012BB8804|nr:bacillithiol biosynthesis cysteine-adding enzyme BshC [Fulvivirga aurantia]MTI22891.1 bacillithiol biosynthesis cysteine-adding enzyme BshC [Fulvivirga aurantia]